MYYKPFAGFCQFAALDKPVGMGIIVDVRGHCDKRSALLNEKQLKKPSLARVAVSAFHNDRHGEPSDM
mgnify:CR=1 FL=1